jgi:hypothetical protein
MPHLTDEEPAAENGLRLDLLITICDKPKPAFDFSLTWLPSGSRTSRCGTEVVNWPSDLAKFLHLFGFCRTFLSGGTRIRTEDTMIFSHIQRPLGMR